MIALVALLLALVGRFSQLDRKLAWHDETYTSLMLAARPAGNLSETLFRNQLVTPAELLAFQSLTPEASLAAMLARKSGEDAQHPPLYSLLAWFWARLLGPETASIRACSALLGLLLFPAVHGLCRELYGSALSGWVGLALFAVSPFHLAFAQEARQFSFWTALIVLASALLLRAQRRPSRRHWLHYGLAIVAASYTALFTAWVAIGHGLWLLLAGDGNQLRARTACAAPAEGGLELKLSLSRPTLQGLTALTLAGLACLPWLAIVLSRRREIAAATAWVASPLPPHEAAGNAMANLSRAFVDTDPAPGSALAWAAGAVMLALQGIALVVVCRRGSGRTRWFLLTLIGTTVIGLGIQDLLLGGQRLAVSRYLIPAIVGGQLAVVGLLSLGLAAPEPLRRRAAALTLSVLLLLGGWSSWTFLRASTWWTKELNRDYAVLAARINASPRPLIIGDAYGHNPASLVSLSALLRPEAQLLLLPPVGTTFPAIDLPPDRTAIVLFNLPESFRQRYAQSRGTTLRRVFRDRSNDVWEAPPPDDSAAPKDPADAAAAG